VALVETSPSYDALAFALWPEIMLMIFHREKAARAATITPEVTPRDVNPLKVLN
jgi:hypothetical protein